MESFIKKNDAEKLVDSKPVDRCYTLACWRVAAHPVVPKVQEYLEARGLATYERATSPGRFAQFTTDGLKELRKSPFLFLRKVEEYPKILDSCETFSEVSERLLTSDNPEPAFSNSLSSATDATAPTTDLEFLTSEFRKKYFGSWTDVAKGDTIIEAEEGRQPRELVLNARSRSRNKFIWGGYALICGGKISIQFYDQVLEGRLALGEGEGEGGSGETGVIHWQNGAQWKRSTAEEIGVAGAGKSAKDAVEETGVTAVSGIGAAGAAGAAGTEAGVPESRMPSARDEVANIPRALPLELVAGKVERVERSSSGITSASSISSSSRTASVSSSGMRSRSSDPLPNERQWFSYNMDADGVLAVENSQYDPGES